MQRARSFTEYDDKPIYPPFLYSNPLESQLGTSDNHADWPSRSRHIGNTRDLRFTLLIPSEKNMS